MENHEVILQDEHHKQFKIVKVQDVRFDKNTLNNSYQWLWIFDHSSEFFPFELWDELDHATVHQKNQTWQSSFQDYQDSDEENES